MRSYTSARANSLLVNTVNLTKIYHKEVNENNCFVFPYKLPFFNQIQQWLNYTGNKFSNRLLNSSAPINYDCAKIIPKLFLLES